MIKNKVKLTPQISLNLDYWVSIINPKTAIAKTIPLQSPWTILILLVLYFISGFTALLYQVAWQRMLGLFSGSDVRSVTIIIASYLLGLGLGNLISSFYSDRLSCGQCVSIYGGCNLAIALFAVASRFLFYDVLFLKLRYLAQSNGLTLIIVFASLLIPTTLMGLSLPLLSKAITRNLDLAASGIGWLYGVNTLGSGLGTLISGWFIIGSLGYDKTVYLGATFSATVGLTALILARWFENSDASQLPSSTANLIPINRSKSLKEWHLLVFFSGFAAISWEIIWFRVLDIALQSNAYTYAHLLAFVLISNAVGSLIGAKSLNYIRRPKKVFLLIQALVAIYSAIAIWAISVYWQAHPHLRVDIGYIDPAHLDGAIIFKYLIVPALMMVVPNLLLGFYFPLVQKAVQSDRDSIGKRVGSILVANILGNTTGSLLTGLVLLESLGTSGSIKLLCCLGLGFIVAIRPQWLKAKMITCLAVVAWLIILLFPSNHRLWGALQAVNPNAYLIVAEDSTSVAAIAETNGQGVLYASGQIQANFPYLHLHGLLGTVPALLHPQPTDIMIIGLGSGGTPHTVGVNPATKRVKVVELLGAELTVLRQYAQTPVGKPLQYLLHDPRYEIIVGDGRRELVLTPHKFDLIEADAIQPWRSRAGMLYSQEFFQEVKSKLKPGGFFVEWNVGAGTQETMLSVFPYVANIHLDDNLWVLIAGDRPIEFERETILTKLNLPQVTKFLDQAGIDIQAIARDVQAATVTMHTQAEEVQSQLINTDLFPRGEYYLNISNK